MASTFYDPNPPPDGKEFPKFPPGWECKVDHKTGRYYYVNHLLRLTSWDDPRLRNHKYYPSPPPEIYPFQDFSGKKLLEERYALIDDHLFKQMLTMYPTVHEMDMRQIFKRHNNNEVGIIAELSTRGYCPIREVNANTLMNQAATNMLNANTAPSESFGNYPPSPYRSNLYSSNLCGSNTSLNTSSPKRFGVSTSGVGSSRMSGSVIKNTIFEMVSNLHSNANSNQQSPLHKNYAPLHVPGAFARTALRDWTDHTPQVTHVRSYSPALNDKYRPERDMPIPCGKSYSPFLPMSPPIYAFAGRDMPPLGTYGKDIYDRTSPTFETYQQFGSGYSTPKTVPQTPKVQSPKKAPQSPRLGSPARVQTPGSPVIPPRFGKPNLSRYRTAPSERDYQRPFTPPSSAFTAKVKQITGLVGRFPEAPPKSQHNFGTYVIKSITKKKKKGKGAKFGDVESVLSPSDMFPDAPPPASPKIKYRYLHTIYPKVDEAVLYHVLKNAEGDVTEAMEMLADLGFDRPEDEPIPKRTNVIDRLTSPPPKPPRKILTDAEKKEMKTELIEQYPDLSPDIITMALETMFYDMVNTRTLIDNSLQDEREKHELLERSRDKG